jgi:hypothetical protein
MGSIRSSQRIHVAVWVAQADMEAAVAVRVFSAVPDYLR